MLSPRRSFGMCVFNGKAYVIGGNDGTRDLNTVEEYDPLTNTWYTLYTLYTISFLILSLFNL